MARRGFGGTALRAALGAVTGVAEGLQQRDLLAAQKQKDEDARQMQLAGLLSQGFAPVSDVQRKQQMAVGAAGSLIGSALNAASMPFAGTAAGLPSTEAQKYLAQGYVGAQPGRTIKFGGQELSMAETPDEREQRLKQTNAMQLRLEKENERYREQQERGRTQGIVERALATGATETDKAAAISEKLLTPGQVGYMTAQEKEQAARQKRLDALQERKLNAEIKKLNENGDAGKPMTPAELTRLSEAQANSRTATIFMNGIESDWDKRDVKINPLDVARVQELMEGKGFTAGKAIASIWGSAANPFSLDKATRQQLEDYMSYAKMHSNAIRLIAARGGSNLLQQTEQQLVSAAWAGGDKADIARARAARDAINSSLESALEASGVSLKLSQTEANRTGKPIGSPAAQPAPASGGFPSYEEWAKSRKK